jgi:hypothetical protein
VDQLCEDLDPAMCQSLAGLPGYCEIGQACGAPSCDEALILPVEGALVEKLPGTPDLRLSWAPDPNSNAYSLRYVLEGGEIPALRLDNTGTSIPGRDPSTILEALHSGALTGNPGEVRYYHVLGQCLVVVGNGACCLPDGSCGPWMEQADCEGLNGSYIGDGVDCALVDCPPPEGACCEVDGSCTDGVYQHTCEDRDGVWQGMLTDCTTVTCPGPRGACCLLDGSCTPWLEEDACIGLNGVYQGDGIDCDHISCTPPTGACCETDGSCTDGVLLEDCEARAGIFQGALTECLAVNCPQPTGACCETDGSCTDGVEQPVCEGRDGVYQGDGSDCSTVSCPQPDGACCMPDMSCEDVPEDTCDDIGGLWQGAGTDCASVSCPRPPAGACCMPDLSCSHEYQIDCEFLFGGFFVGECSDCSTGPCASGMDACRRSGSVLHLDGDPGDWIHPGTVTITDGTFTPTLTPVPDPHTVSIHVDPTDPGQGAWWDAGLSSRELGVPLAVGTYTDAERLTFASPGHPGLSVTGDGRGCNTISGQFWVHQISVAGGVLQSFTASWEQHCEAGVPQLRGCVRYEP